MISKADFQRLIHLLGEEADDDITWAESITEPEDAEDFALEVIFVICNSGMKNTIARQIYDRVATALKEGRSASEKFGHKGKAQAIDRIWRDRAEYFRGFQRSLDKLTYCGNLPWIGNITKYHVAKNFGVDVAKPDVHLARLAEIHQTTPQALCEALARETGYRVATVDTIIWRACANGILNSRTGEIANR